MTAELYKSNASDLDVARAAWVSQNSESHKKEAEEGRVAGLINFLWKSGHYSPFEHGSMTFIIHAPITVQREFMRSRTWSYNEISGRYVELPMEFYMPNEDRPMVQTGKVGNYVFSSGSPDQRAIMLQHQKRAVESSVAAYQAQLDAGVAKEVARNILPVNTMTTFWATANPRNVLNFLTLRNSDEAMYEIRAVAQQMEEIFAQQMPLTYKAYKDNK